MSQDECLIYTYLSKQMLPRIRLSYPLMPQIINDTTIFFFF